ncbi:MAG: hypothetical protein HY659_16030 [Rhizobiales bacterium]|nr:hypothetical protein [Hyphomicrobiales bacterium]
MAISGNLMFRCPVTGREINSGFNTDQDGLRGIPPMQSMHVRCPACWKLHDLKFSAGWILPNAASVGKRVIAG